ncbi:hypothetical protein CW745_01260 [Psychromonas sp. psych-6C06]|uniref:hypothetical protein n=1 Tax=Psychromonas sp. psych-6C06 TaxID=2058089 RepID=UPI000C3419A3|nr:hypothetical protein [Psychromonas sp. psych-6C06]PKF63508.1 hypothetical protein CW745_01260 [Psychromonas sp. psych-6C06]
MLTIRQEQISVMMQDKQSLISATLSNALKGLPFFQFYSSKQLQIWVSKQIDYLAALNIHEKENVENILELLAMHGENFERCDDPSWALTIIEDINTHEGIRAVMLKRAHQEYLDNFE